MRELCNMGVLGNVPYMLEFLRAEFKQGPLICYVLAKFVVGEGVESMCRASKKV